MPQVFTDVPGEAGSLLFKFNGQFALKNYNVEIVNGNRLKVTSAENEMFSLLEVDVTEVEINGMIYSDAQAAQIALQSLVYSDEAPQIITQQEKTAIIAGFRGIITPADSPTLAGTYKPSEVSEQGTVYPHCGNLTAKSGFDTLFYFDGTSWSKAEIELPQVDVSQTFDANNTTDPVVQKAIADRYDKKVGMLDSFLNADTTTPIKTVTIPQSVVITGGHFLKNDNTYLDNPAYPNACVVFNYPVGKASRFRVMGLTNVQPGGQFAAVTGKKKDGTAAVLLPWTAPDIVGEHIFDVSDFTFVSVQTWAADAFPTLELLEYPTIYTDVKEYIDNDNTVLDYFIKPYEVLWETLPMPQPNEKDDAIINTAWAQYSAAGTANGVILISNLPPDADLLEIEGNFNVGGAGTLWIGGFNETTGVYEKLMEGLAGSGKKVFEINRAKYKGYVYSRTDDNQKYRIGRTVKLEKQKDSVKKYIDNHISNGSTISNEKSAQIKRPAKVLRLEFTTTDPLPVDKTTIASGTVLITDFEGLGIKKFATIEVQGSSSAIYPKKNWTFALYNDAAKTDSFKLRVGNWCEHSELVYKANWIDATHARNLVSNAIWEDIVQSRTYFPKRENERAYTEGDTQQLGRFDSGALTHVDGVPCELYINGGFYGIGNFNLGKKRENYDLKSSNQNHIQLAAETHADFYVYKAAEWEIRNPKTPDTNFQTKIKAWFDSNALTGAAFKSSFEANHDLKNAIDFYLLAEFIQSPDMYTKNLMVTSWDGVKFYFLPYDMDTTFGLQWDGGSFTGWTSSIRSASFWQKFYTAYSVEIKARYADLKAKGVFTFNNVYKHADKINKTFGINLYQKEQTAWASIPSNSTIYTGFSQIYDWTKKRIDWLDTQYS